MTEAKTERIGRFDHIGIPNHQNNPFGIQWQRYWDDAPYPELVRIDHGLRPDL